MSDTATTNPIVTPAAMPGGYYRVVNTGTVAIRMKISSPSNEALKHWLVIAPGQEAMIEEPYVKGWFGDWTIRDAQARATEYDRLHGVYGGNMDGGYEARRYRADIFDLTGARIIPLIDDPEGTLMAPPPPSVTEVEALRLAYEAQQKRLDALQARLDVAEDAEHSDAVVDAPPPTRGPKKA
jgi:hypothetical protein